MKMLLSDWEKKMDFNKRLVSRILSSQVIEAQGWQIVLDLSDGYRLKIVDSSGMSVEQKCLWILWQGEVLMKSERSSDPVLYEMAKEAAQGRILMLAKQKSLEFETLLDNI